MIKIQIVWCNYLQIGFKPYEIDLDRTGPQNCFSVLNMKTSKNRIFEKGYSFSGVLKRKTSIQVPISDILALEFSVTNGWNPIYI